MTTPKPPAKKPRKPTKNPKVQGPGGLKAPTAPVSGPPRPLPDGDKP